MVGVDIIRAAADAARRDRQHVYDNYFVLDMTGISDRELCLQSLGAKGNTHSSQALRAGVHWSVHRVIARVRLAPRSALDSRPTR
jgi:hypothetical protein